MLVTCGFANEETQHPSFPDAMAVWFPRPFFDAAHVAIHRELVRFLMNGSGSAGFVDR